MTAFFALFFTVSISSIYAAEQKTMAVSEKSDEQALKPEDVKQLREAAAAISTLLDRNKTSADKAQSSQSNETKKDSEESKKNMADVADRALSLLSGYVGSAAQAMQKVAPEVWRVMIRQQYANAIAYPFFPCVLIFVTVLYMVTIKKWWKKPEFEGSDDWVVHFWFTGIIPFVSLVILIIWAGYDLSYSIQMLINPEYFAFKDLLSMLLNRGMI